MSYVWKSTPALFHAHKCFFQEWSEVTKDIKKSTIQDWLSAPVWATLAMSKVTRPLVKCKSCHMSSPVWVNLPHPVYPMPVLHCLFIRTHTHTRDPTHSYSQPLTRHPLLHRKTQNLVTRQSYATIKISLWEPKIPRRVSVLQDIIMTCVLSERMLHSIEYQPSPSWWNASR